jgi:hypothetical protein
VWERLGEAKEPWYLPHLGPPPAPAYYDYHARAPKGLTASILHDRLVVVGGVVEGSGNVLV